MSRTIQTSIGTLEYVRTETAYGITSYWVRDARGHEYKIRPWARKTQDGVQLYGVESNGCHVDVVLQIVGGKLREVRATTRSVGHNGIGHIYHTTISPL